MEFYSASSEKRPVRLPESIRKWAWESEHGRYGDETAAHAGVSLDDILDFDSLTDLEKYDRAIRRIAEEAPVRLCPGERIAGSATLGLAISHRVPATYRGEAILPSVSHLTPDYRFVLTDGMNGYARLIEKRLGDKTLSPSQRSFLLSLENVVESMRVWHARYLEATSGELHALLDQVPFGPARTFHEAVQSLWFVFAFMRLCGNWPGIGRIDQLLSGYLRQDLQEGRMTVPEAREILASMFVKGCEWIQSDTPRGSGDAQHYQNIVLAGVDEDGQEVACEVTDLVLDIVEELAISDFPITVRVNQNTPEWLLRHMARVMRHGGGIVAVYNEELILRALDAAGYPARAARRFANDGCWEVQIPGETCFGYIPFDALQILDDVLGAKEDGPIPRYESAEALYAAFCARLKEKVGLIYEQCVEKAYQRCDGEWKQPGSVPCSVVSLFTAGCLDNARSYYDLGPVYTVRSPHIGGAPDVGNSLYAIEKLVFEEKRLSFDQLVTAIRRNWEGFEAERLYVRGKYAYYGNDNDEADAWTARVLNDFADMTRACSGPVPVLFVPGVSTFGRQIGWMPQRAATAFGARRGEILSGNDSPTPGTDFSGATAVIRSYCKADLARQTTGAALDVKLYPGTVAGENGMEAILSLIRGFLSLGGFFMQIDVVDAAVLRAAQEHPEDYKTLSVRVSGWNARFVTLDREWQNMIIERTSQNV